MASASAYTLELKTLASRRRLIWGLKHFLPGLAIFFTITLMVWPALSNRGYTSHEAPTPELQAVPTKNAAHQLIFYTIDSKGYLYEVSADKGVEHSDGQTELINPAVKLTLPSGSLIKLVAERAFFKEGHKKVELQGPVELKHPDGYIFETPSAIIDLETGIALGNEVVEGIGPHGTIHAKGFQISDKGEKLVFYGAPLLVLKR